MAHHFVVFVGTHPIRSYAHRRMAKLLTPRCSLHRIQQRIITRMRPAPGQLVSLEDTLPNPPLGSARYYLMASESGPDRRLGRQYVGGAFSAREPAS